MFKPPSTTNTSSGPLALRTETAALPAAASLVPEVALRVEAVPLLTWGSGMSKLPAAAGAVSTWPVDTPAVPPAPGKRGAAVVAASGDEGGTSDEFSAT